MNGAKSKRDSAKGLRYTHIRVANWRNFLEIDTPLQRRMFLVGPNASGKSNLLDIFRFLYDIVSIGGGLQEAVRKRGGVSSIRSLFARRYSDITIHLTLGDDKRTSAWEYEVTFSQDNLRRPVVKRERVVQQSAVLLDRPNDDDKADPERLTQTYLEQINVNKEFREIADFFRSIRYLHIVPQLIREPDRSVGRKNDPYGGDFLEQIAHVQTRTREAWLRRIQEALQIAVPQLTEIKLSRDDKGTPHLEGKYQHWRPQGQWQSEALFSDGTLRLLGLLWAILDGSGPLLLEEPELSLHPEVVKFIPEMMYRAQRRTGRQIILSTHSPDLLRNEGIGVDEVLMLIPTTDRGTETKLLQKISQVETLLRGGSTIADIVIAHTQPKNAWQLSMFGDL